MIMDQLKVSLKTVQDLQDRSAHAVIQGSIPDEGLIPLKDLNSLQHTESELRDYPDLKKSMITSLGLQGGFDVKDTVWRVMRCTVTNSLAKQLNWRGINGKAGFQNLLLKEVIIGAVRRNSGTSKATVQETEMWIKRWQHLSKDREEGEKDKSGEEPG
ncbi:hypothetical protein AOLI_G00238410 [Acnodon oligacanthus]